MSRQSHECEYNQKYLGVTACPSCGESCIGKINENRARFDGNHELKCEDRFHVWFCGNNYSDERGCYGHSRGSLRCMDQP